MAELVDAQDLKSCAEQSACRFDPGSRQERPLWKQGGFFYITVIPNWFRDLAQEILKLVQND